MVGIVLVLLALCGCVIVLYAMLLVAARCDEMAEWWNEESSNDSRTDSPDGNTGEWRVRDGDERTGNTRWPRD